MDSGLEPGQVASPTRTSPRQRMLRWARQHKGSLWFLWGPTAVTAIYYGLIAADMYASEAKFVVRTPARMQVNALTSLLQGTGIARAQDDVFSIHDFIMSRDAVMALRAVDLRELFSRPEADFLSRYPNILNNSSEEGLYEYYRKRVSVAYDSTTGISTLVVKGFRADDARLLADRLLSESESLVNRLNERSRKNAVRDAEADVKLAEAKVAQAQQNLLAYRNRETMLDPGKASGVIFETLAKMQAELTLTRARLAEIEQTSPDSPLQASLRTRMIALEQEIERERGRLAGSDVSMAPKLAEYERLVLERDFAARALTAASAALEAAQAEARRQQIYLDRVVEPNVPDEAQYPKRLQSILIVLVSCFIGYSIARLLIAGVREHAQG